MKIKTIVIFCLIMSVVFASCKQKGQYKRSKTLSTSENIQLNIVGNIAFSKSIETAITSFSKLYPNVSIEYEYLQDYANLLQKRLADNNDVDLFITNNIQANSKLLPYALELKSQSNLNLSATFEGLVRNFTITEDGKNELYAIPLGGEIRGLFVNKTLLNTLGLSVPKTYDELMHCCKVLKQAGYIPLQGNPGRFGQLLFYPYICNLIANAPDYNATYQAVNTCKLGISKLFTEPFSELYEIVSQDYYNYKYVETQFNSFFDQTDETTVYSFLNIIPDEKGGYLKKDDKSQIAFMPGTMAMKNFIDKTKNDYHFTIDYEFILAPVSNDGGYAYLSPASGIAVNKNSAHVEWSIEFLNFLFSEQENKKFASDQNIVPNTADAMDYLNSKFNIENKNISQLGQVSFDYVFYNVVNKTLIDISKANNPKYMAPDGTMYSFEYYMKQLEDNFAAQRKNK